MTLRPSWIEEDTKIIKSTDYDVMYWVNYGDGSVYGWFTVEQIKTWLTNPELKLWEIGGTKER